MLWSAQTPGLPLEVSWRSLARLHAVQNYAMPTLPRIALIWCHRTGSILLLVNSVVSYCDDMEACV